jgi:hypothetical protein
MIGSAGTFKNLRTGDTGKFVSFRFAAGNIDASVGGGVGLYKNLTRFVGFTGNVSASRSYPGLADAATTSSFSLDGGYIVQSL